MKEICNALDENNYYSEYYNKDKSYLINNPEYTVDLLDDFCKSFEIYLYIRLSYFYQCLDLYINSNNCYDEFRLYSIIKSIIKEEFEFIFIESNYNIIKDVNKRIENYNDNIINFILNDAIDYINSNAKYEFTRKYINMEK